MNFNRSVMSSVSIIPNWYLHLCHSVMIIDHLKFLDSKITDKEKSHSDISDNQCCYFINQPEGVVIVSCARLHGNVRARGLLLDIRSIGLSPFLLSSL